MTSFFHTPHGRHMRTLWAIAHLTLQENWRNRLPWAVALMLGVGVGAAFFLESAAVTETVMVQATIVGAFFRLGMVFLMAVTVISGMAREFGDRMVEMTLALATPRAIYYFGKLVGHALTASLMAIPPGLALLPFAPWDQVALWGVSLLCELWLMAALGLLLVFSLTHVTLALTASMAIYLLARSVGTLVLIAHGPFAKISQWPGSLVRPILDFLSWMLPDLGRFTSGEWLAYHTGGRAELGMILLETAITLFLLCGAGLFDLYRKNF